MTRQEIELLWSDPRNWRSGFYYCKADPRVITPKRIRSLGWTINFAHPKAVPVLLGLLGLIFIPAPLVFFIFTLLGIVIGVGTGIPPGFGALIGLVLGGLTFIACIIAVCLISDRMARRPF